MGAGHTQRDGGPILVPCLVALRAEFNLVAPGRDKRSDGWIGDRAHALNSSDHNGDESGRTPYEDADFVDEVHGLDVDDTGPWPEGPAWFDRQVEKVRARHATGLDDRLQNIIRNRRIASRSWGWEWRPYSGSNPHTEHAHFSARYTTAQETDESSWGVAPEEDDVTPQDIEKVASRAADLVVARLLAADAVQSYHADGSEIAEKAGDPAADDITVANALAAGRRVERKALPQLDRIEAMLTDLQSDRGQPQV